MIKDFYILYISKHQLVFSSFFVVDQEPKSSTDAMEDSVSKHLLLDGNIHVSILREEVYGK